MIRIWNEVVEDGVAFPQEECLDEKTGAEFFLIFSYDNFVFHNDSPQFHFIVSFIVTEGALIERTLSFSKNYMQKHAKKQSYFFMIVFSIVLRVALPQSW